jgi:Family of unknown function (DUF6375)
MKVWTSYGSEHSRNLVMIGHFREARDAEKAKELIDRLTEQVIAEPDVYRSDASPQDHSFSEAMLELLKASNLYSLGPAELEQFSYDARARVEGSDVIVTTEEVEVSAFLKLLLDKGARVEVYSAHDYPDTGYGRGK